MTKVHSRTKPYYLANIRRALSALYKVHNVIFLICTLNLFVSRQSEERHDTMNKWYLKQMFILMPLCLYLSFNIKGVWGHKGLKAFRGRGWE